LSFFGCITKPFPNVLKNCFYLLNFLKALKPFRKIINRAFNVSRLCLQFSETLDILIKETAGPAKRAELVAKLEKGNNDQRWPGNQVRD